MRRTAIATGLVVLALAGAGYAAARIRAATDHGRRPGGVLRRLPAGSTFAYASAEPRLLSRSAHLTGVRLVVGDVTYTAADADVAPDGGHGLRHLVLRQAMEAADHTATSAELVEADGLSVPADTDDLRAVDPKTVRADHLALHGLRFTAADGTAMTVGDLTLDGYGAGRPATLGMRAVSVAAPGQQVDRLELGALRLSGVDLSRVMPPVEPEVVAAIPGLSPLATVSGVTVVARGKPLVTIAAAQASLTHLAVTDLVVLADDELTPGLRKAGYDRFQGTLVVDAAVDRGARQLRLTQADLVALGMGHAHLSAAFDNLPPDLLGPALDASHVRLGVFELAGLQLRALAFSYEDRSLAGKLLEAAAAQRGVTRAQLVAGAQAQLRAVAAQYGVPDAVVAPALAFLGDPHWLSVTVEPPQPVPVIGLPSLLRGTPAQTLGLRVTNQPAPQ